MNLLWLMLVAIGVAIAVQRYVASERRGTLAAFAGREGLRFDPGRDSSLTREYFFFDCLQRGSSRYAYNILSGEVAGLTVTGFDYRYDTGGDNLQTYRFSAVVVVNPRPLRPLLIRPRNVLDRIGASVGLEDIDLDSAEFGSRFLVKATSPSWAHDVFHPRMMKFFLTGPGLSLQVDRDAMIAWRESCFSPEDFRQACHFVRGFLDRLPDHLARGLESGTPRDGPDAGASS